MKKILYILVSPSPDKIKYFNRLSKYVDLTVVYEKKLDFDGDLGIYSNPTTSHKTIFLQHKKSENHLSKRFNLKKVLLTEKYDYILFCNYTSLTGVIGIWYCNHHKIRYSIEADGISFTKHFVFEKMNKTIFKKAQYCFSTCNNLDEYFMKLGANPKKIQRYKISPFTFDEMYKNRSMVNISSICDIFTILYIGEFNGKSGVDILLKSIEKIKCPVKLILVGGNLSPKYKAIIKNNNLTNVSIYPYVNQYELVNIYQHTNLFVYATKDEEWGLVISEALSFGIPVITTDRCNAGLVLINDKYNGLIVKHNDINSLSSGINTMIDLLNKNNLSHNCFESVFEYTIDNMVCDHIDVFK